MIDSDIFNVLYKLRFTVWVLSQRLTSIKEAEYTPGVLCQAPLIKIESPGQICRDSEVI